jgi:hypothetical protein
LFISSISDFFRQALNKYSRAQQPWVVFAVVGVLQSQRLLMFLSHAVVALDVDM